MFLRLGRSLAALLVAAALAVSASGCASNRTDPVTTSSIGSTPGVDALPGLAERYGRNPTDRGTLLGYAAGLRAAGQSGQAVSVLENGIAAYPDDTQIAIAYAKALTETGRFEQALQVVNNAIRPDLPDWNALLVKGAALDQLGRNGEARQLYTQALTLAPGEASIEANLGLSFAMTNDLPAAEQHLRRASQMVGATSKIRQNLALIVGLQGRFEEAQALYAAELPAEQVAANMASLRAMLSQPNRWDSLKQG